MTKAESIDHETERFVQYLQSRGKSCSKKLARLMVESGNGARATSKILNDITDFPPAVVNELFGEYQEFACHEIDKLRKP